MNEKKSWQVLTMCEGGKKFSVIFHNDGRTNPYYLYRHTWGVRKDGYGYGERKRIEVKYADFRSCLYYIVNQF